jgi:pimeloyl-ACP methyl ester carboxylesterase
LTPDEHPKAVQFDGINGQLVGAGQVGVVLTNGSADDPCVFSPLLPALLSAGRYRVLLYFYRLGGNQEIERDVALADGFMLKLGVKEVILVGQSLGGARTLVAAARIQPPPTAAVSFSGESTPDEVSALNVPTLIFASENDHYFPGSTARQVIAAIPSSDKSLIVYPGGLHGLAILSGPYGPAALSIFIDFLSRHVKTPQ